MDYRGQHHHPPKSRGAEPSVQFLTAFLGSCPLALLSCSPKLSYVLKHLLLIFYLAFLSSNSGRVMELHNLPCRQIYYFIICISHEQHLNPRKIIAKNIMKTCFTILPYLPNKSHFYVYIIFSWLQRKNDFLFEASLVETAQ